MASGRVRLAIWCEDRRHEQFLRKLFATPEFGLTNRELTFKVAPRGTGSAAQWVASNFHNALRLARVERHQRRLGVLVMIDGDSEGIEARKRELLVPPNDRRDQLNLAIWVPTRNIETWVKFLSDQPLGVGAADWETTDFKTEVGRQWEQMLPVAIERWRVGEASPLRSLVDAHQELERLPFR